MSKRYESLEAFVSGRIECTEGGCWEWARSARPDGYAMTVFNGKYRLVHRVSALFFHGLDIDDRSQVVDHICRNRKCCNPSHLRVVTQQENVLADGSLAVAKARADKTHCPKCGGDYTIYQPAWLKGKSVRRCLPCDSAYKAEWAARKENGSLHAKW